MKGILLAGGSGTRLYPLTRYISKQLLPIYDKPMIYYSLSVLMLAGIREVAFVCNKAAISMYESVLGHGEGLGMQIVYIEQEKPNGIAEAFILAKDFIGSDTVALILGDNLIYGQTLTTMLDQGVGLIEQNSEAKLPLGSAHSSHIGAVVFAYPVADPERFGIVELDSSGRAISLVEKPKKPKSNLAVTGLYFYDNKVVEFAKNLKPSARGELEITDINAIYLEKGELEVIQFGRGFAFIDCGTPTSMLEAGSFVATIEKRCNYKIACIEEIAFNNGWLSPSELESIITAIKEPNYKMYLSNILREKTWQ